MSGVGATPQDVPRLAVHTMTTKPLDLADAVREYSRRGIPGISVWLEALEGYEPRQARQLIEDHGLSVPALVRGGFFCAGSAPERSRRIDLNRRHIDTAQQLGADMLVLVVGAIPGVALETQRSWVGDGIAALVDDAQSAGIRLAIEPLHPMYAGDKSCINRIAEADAICDRIENELVGVAVDVYHVWWDPDLRKQISNLGQKDRLFAFHLCDWRVPTRDLLTDRGLMGDGCIDLRAICSWVKSAGFDGWHEVEIFSEELWAEDQGQFLDRIIDRFRRCC